MTESLGERRPFRRVHRRKLEKELERELERDLERIIYLSSREKYTFPNFFSALLFPEIFTNK